MPLISDHKRIIFSEDIFILRKQLLRGIKTIQTGQTSCSQEKAQIFQEYGIC